MSATDTNDTQTAPTQSVTFFGKMLTFSRLKLNTDDLNFIKTQLNTLVGNRNSQIPIVIDSDVNLDLHALVEMLWNCGLQPIGVVTGVLDEQATAQRLAIFPADGKRIERIVPKKSANTHQAATSLQEPTVTDTADKAVATDKDPQSDVLANSAQNNVATDVHTQPTTTTETSTSASVSANTSTNYSAQTQTDSLTTDHITSLVYDQMLRSGQSINHVGGDLILTNSINNGAEAITDNSLHIYGRAQGRLVAGATGDKDARIFCQSFNPSLVSVAGTYCLRDNIPADVIDKPVQVRYQEGEGLVFTVMNNY